MYEFSAIISNSVSRNPYDYHIMLICGSQKHFFFLNSCTAYYFVENVIHFFQDFLMIRKLNYLT